MPGVGSLPGRGGQARAAGLAGSKLLSPVMLSWQGALGHQEHVSSTDTRRLGSLKFISRSKERDDGLQMAGLTTFLMHTPQDES